ncbi:MAG: hypothetical protein ACUVTN_09595 [Thermodesulfobacteriota bacterium]
MEKKENTLEEILFQLTLKGISSLRKVLFWGEGAEELSSYVGGWIASRGMDVILLDGANRFDPYVVSSFGKKVLIPPERLLKKILIARAFTCYQMVTLIERLVPFIEESIESSIQNWYFILLGPLGLFLDQEVSEREALYLFKRAFGRIEVMAGAGASFFIFQHSIGSHFPFRKGGRERGGESRKNFLTKRLFQFSDLVWKIYLEGQKPRVVLIKGIDFKHTLENSQLQKEEWKIGGNLHFGLRGIDGTNSSSF